VKALLQTILRNWPNLVDCYSVGGLISRSTPFKDSFDAAKAGFVPLYEVDGVCFVRPTVVDGIVSNDTRSPCTSAEVVDARNRIFSMAVELARFVTQEAIAVACAAEALAGASLTALDLELVSAGKVVVLRERNSGLEITHDGHRIALPARDDANAAHSAAASGGASTRERQKRFGK
jgi:hypothetical protein